MILEVSAVENVSEPLLLEASLFLGFPLHKASPMHIQILWFRSISCGGLLIIIIIYHLKKYFYMLILGVVSLPLLMPKIPEFVTKLKTEVGV